MCDRSPADASLRIFPSSSHDRSAGGGGGGQPAKDRNGNEIKSKEWLKTHPAGDHTLSQGLKVRCPHTKRVTTREGGDAPSAAAEGRRRQSIVRNGVDREGDGSNRAR